MTMREKRANLGTGGSMKPGQSAARGPYWGEALHGLEEDCGQSYPFAEFGGNSTGCPTSFPHGTALGATFNRTLWSSIGTAMGAEARGMWNQQKGPIWFFSPPDVNLARDPRWGRAQEVAGEDPFLNGEFGIAIASTLEHPVLPEAPAVGPTGPYRAAISCTKHFAAYDCENCKPCDKRTMDSYFNYTTDPNQLYCDRQHFNAIIPDQDIVDYYLPSFRAVIEANVSSSVMCSYNDINGVPSCANSFTLTHMLREEWGFDGFVISDCGALINFNMEAYKFSKLGNDTARHVAAVMNGGCDSGCDALLNNNVTYALQKGTITPETLDTALLRLYRKYVETGQLDGESQNAESFGMFGPQTVDTPHHRALALEAAQQATILLQNNVPTGKTSPLLPIKPGTKIAVIGPHSMTTKDLLSIYVGGNDVVLNQTMLQAVTRYAASHGSSVVGYDHGCANDTSGSAAGQPWEDRNEIACKNTSYFGDSIELAKRADVVLMFMGLAPTSGAVGIAGETEGCDRPDDLSLPNRQSDLVAAITAANPNVVLTIIHGGASLSLEDEKISCPAIVDAHYPGQSGGDAVASILFGDVSPSGRLTTTMYPLDFVNQRNISDMGLMEKGGITYKHYTGTPTFVFGHGLSFTTFTFEHVSTFGSRHVVSAAALAADDRRFYRGRHLAGADAFAARSASSAPAAAYDIKVTNTGSVASAVVVLGFLNSSHANAPVNTELFDFARVPMLAAGASTTVTLAMTPSVLATTDVNGVQSILPGTYTVRFGVEGAAETQTASATLIVQGEYTLFNLPAARSTHKANMAKKFGDTAEVHYDW
jgi:beta-glucosidase-like glycosyl hydrolase